MDTFYYLQYLIQITNVILSTKLVKYIMLNIRCFRFLGSHSQNNAKCEVSSMHTNTPTHTPTHRYKIFGFVSMTM